MLDFARPIRRGLAANSTASGFTAKSPVVAKPSNDGVVDLVQDGITVPQLLKLWAVGVGTANDAFSVRVYGWSQILSTTTGVSAWLPQPIAELAFILGAKTGVLATVLPSTELIADTVTIVKEPVLTADVTPLGTIRRYNPADDTVAFVVIPVYGFQLIEFDFDQTTNTPTMNVLYSLL